MTKKEQQLQEALAVMTADRDGLQSKVDAQEDTRPFQIMVKKNDGQSNNWILVGFINGQEFSADLVKRNSKELISTQDFVNNHNEARKRPDFQEVFERKARYDALATQKNVASQGDVPSAS